MEERGGAASRARSGKFIRKSGFKTRPLCGGTSARPLRCSRPIWWSPIGSREVPLARPAGWRILPCLLASENREVQERVAVVHDLRPSPLRPVRLEDVIVISQIRHEMEQADFAPDKEGLEGLLRRIPGQLPTHEGPIAVALVIGPLAQHCEGDATRLEIGQLADLTGDPRATFALLGRLVTGVPHEVVGEQ